VTANQINETAYEHESASESVHESAIENESANGNENVSENGNEIVSESGNEIVREVVLTVEGLDLQRRALASF